MAASRRPRHPPPARAPRVVVAQDGACLRAPGWVNLVATFADVAFVCIHDDSEIEQTVQVPYEVTPSAM